MKTVNLKEKARQIKWTTEHTLTDSQFKNKLAEKLLRAKQFVRLNRVIDKKFIA
jgi:hypothetical protein